MKRLKVATWMVGMAALLFFSLATGLTYAGDQAIGMKDYKKLAKEGFANADGTRKIVANVLNTIAKETADSGSSDLLKGEVKDAKYWFKRANDLLEKCKKQMDAKKFDKDLVINLNQAWQWFVKAGSAAVRASMMP